MKKTALLTAVAILAVSLSGCSLFRKKPKYAGDSDGDYVSGTSLGDTPLSERQDGVDYLSSNVEKGRYSPVQFGFDSYEVEPSQEHKIHAIAQILHGSSRQLVIAGFTDERGTAEYNRGLGERRAQAVRSELIHQGIDSGRIQTTSFGAEMPVDPSSNESAWAKNRRAEFGVTR